MDELLLDETMEFRTQLGQYFGSRTRTTMDFVDFLREQHIFDSDRRISKKKICLETSKNSYQRLRFHLWKLKLVDVWNKICMMSYRE